MPEPGTTTAEQRPGRYRSLDGVRGLAALVVVFHHAFLVIPVFALAYTGVQPLRHSLSWWLLYSPLHLLWAGNEAVWVFFLLSGFVLALPWARRAGGGWVAYYAGRLPRLYLPVWGSLVVATVLALLVPRVVTPNASFWLNAYAHPPSVAGVLHDAFLLRGVTTLNWPLWTLQYEVVFSLLLPVYILAAEVTRRWWWPVRLVLVFAAVAAGPRSHYFTLTYLPMFGVGVLMAYEHERLARWGRRAARWRFSDPLWVVLTVVSLLAIVASWTFVVHPGLSVLPWWTSFPIVGAAGLLVCAMLWGPLRRLLETPVFQWLGTRSFSLYLVHAPILVTVATLAGLAHVKWTLYLGVPLALLGAEIFFRLVERPSHRLSGRIRRRLAARRGEAATSGPGGVGGLGQGEVFTVPMRSP